MKIKMMLAAFAAAVVAGGVVASMALAGVTAPPLPVNIAAGATFSNVTLNGTSSNLAVVLPGSANTIKSTLTIAPAPGGTYFTAPVGFAYAASPFPGCPEGGYGDTDTVTQNFTAPGIAGVYDIVVDIGPNFTCQDSWHANAGQGTIARIVVTSFSSVCSLAESFSTDPDVAAGLCDKLAAAAGAAERGNTTAEANILKAFGNQVAAQTGKALTEKQADMLMLLVSYL